MSYKVTNHPFSIVNAATFTGLKFADFGQKIDLHFIEVGGAVCTLSTVCTPGWERLGYSVKYEQSIYGCRYILYVMSTVYGTDRVRIVHDISYVFGMNKF